MRRPIALIAKLLVSILLTAAVHAGDIRFVGTAYELDGNKLLYTEHHDISLDSKGKYAETRVDYLQPNKELLARKYLDFSQNELMPNMRFVDFRVGEGVEVRMSKGKAEIIRVEGLSDSVDFSMPLSSQGKVASQKILERETSGQVLDAGFDRMAAKKWSELMKGSTIEFDFLALSRDDFVGFELSKTKMTEQYNVLEIAPQSWLIGLLMTPIVLEYDKSNQRLMRYRGVTNIAAEEDGQVQDGNYFAEIKYEYLTNEKSGEHAIHAMNSIVNEPSIGRSSLQ